MSKLNAEQEQLLKAFVNLARKLGKVPSIRDTKRFLCSQDKFTRIFGSFNAMKEEALKRHTELADFLTKVELNAEDLQNYRIEKYKKEVANKNKTLVSNVSSLDYIQQFAEQTFSGKITPIKKSKSKVGSSSRALNLTLSDLHFGADIHSKETGFLDYGPTEEARRFAAVIKQTVEYKPHYRQETELHVNLLGDIIQHKLHDSQDAAPMAEQVCRAIHLLSQGFAQLAEAFPKVVVHCATGNHGRNLSRHQERATSAKWDSVETIIYYSVKKSLSKYDNLSFEIPKTPFCMYEALGHKVFATHGDTVLSPGNPGKSLNIGKLEAQVNRINAGLKDNDEVKVAIVGHTHCASVSQLSNGTTLVTNGCLPPVDGFATSIGILENNASQTIFEMVKEHALGDIRFIRVGQVEDNDESLDKVVAPWTTL